MEVTTGSPEVAAQIESHRVDRIFVQQVGTALRQESKPVNILKKKIQELTQAGLVEGEEGESVAAYIGIGRVHKILTDGESLGFLAEAHQRKAALLKEKVIDTPYAREYFTSQEEFHDRRSEELRNLLTPTPQEKPSPSTTSPKINDTVVSTVTEKQQEESDMQQVIGSVVDTTISGKFPSGAYIERKKTDGSLERFIVEEEGRSEEYTSGGWKKLPLAYGLRPEGEGLNVVSGAVRKEYVENKTRDKGKDIVYVTNFAPDQKYIARNPDVVRYANGAYVIVDYAFIQAGGDASNRPLDFVHVLNLMPRDQAKKLVALIKKDPRKIQELYRATSSGLEAEIGGDNRPRVLKVNAPELVLIDLTSLTLPLDALSDMAEGNAAYLLQPLLNLLEKAGEIPHLSYNNTQQEPVSAEEKQRLDEQFRTKVERIKRDRLERDAKKVKEQVALPAEQPRKKRFGFF